MKYLENKEDLFNYQNECTLIHCISLDCEMGAGIAVGFNNRYPGMKQYLKRDIKARKIDGPTAIQYSNVINMITKRLYWHKPTYEDLELSLISVRNICKRNNINKIAMPLIGCGLDGLNWHNVKLIIESVFDNEDIELIVCYL